jgi:DNA-binding NtrC family response regulator
LQNVIERSVIMAQKRRVTVEDLGSQFAGIELSDNSAVRKRRCVERQEVANALRETGGNVTKAAALLGIHRRQFQRLVQRYRIDRANPG